MAKFGTVEVYEELATLLGKDEEWIEKGKGVDKTLVFQYTEPVSKAFLIRFEAGQITTAKELASADEEAADFVLTGSPDGWRGLHDGSISPMKAMTSGQLKLKGNMMGLMKEIKAFGHVMGSLTKIELT